MNYAKLNQAYEEITGARYIRSIYNDEQFTDWCRNVTVIDLECALAEFEREEMYEDCCIIRNVIKEKKQHEKEKILGDHSR